MLFKTRLLLLLITTVILFYACNHSNEILETGEEALSEIEGQLLVEIHETMEGNQIAGHDYKMLLVDDSGEIHQLSADSKEIAKYSHLSGKKVKIKAHSLLEGEITPTSIEHVQGDESVSLRGPRDASGLKILVVMFTDAYGGPDCTFEDVKYSLMGEDNPASTTKMYEKVSGGKVTIASVESAEITYENTAYCSPSNLYNISEDKLIAQGIVLEDYDNFMFVTSNRCGPVALLNGQTSIISYCNYSIIDVVLAHELGHNLGMNHSNSISSTGASIEYGDYSCFMSNKYSELNPLQRMRNGWIKGGSIRKISSGVYSVSALESTNPTEKILYKINKRLDIGGVSHNYYVSYRTDTGNFPAYSSCANSLCIYRWSGNSDDKTALVDNISVGETFADTENNISITSLGVQGEVMEFRVD